MRPRFQLHLLTLLALSFSAAALLWLNIRHSPGFTYVADYKMVNEEIEPVLRQYSSVGWPRSFLMRNSSLLFIESHNTIPPGRNVAIVVPMKLPIQLPQNYCAVQYRSLALDFAIALAILFAITLLSELAIRGTRVRT